jgi:RimJ/RimL family protein N-acetyltransferase
MTAKRCIFKIDPSQVTQQFRSLFNLKDPTYPRCLAVLDGNARGLIFTDSLDNPIWGVVHEAASSRLFMGGNVHYPCLRRLVHRLRQHGKVMVGMWPNDARWRLLPQAADQACLTLDFSDRQARRLPPASFHPPDGCELRWLDLDLLEGCAKKDHYLSMFGSAQHVLRYGLGLCLVHQYNGHPPEVLCEAFAGPAALGSIEISTQTHASYRHKGYATITCHHLVSEVERLGYRTYASCSKDNHASIALARKLGYRTEQEYRFMAWFKHDS